MAWIRVETSLARDPRVNQLKRSLGLHSRAEAAGFVAGLWSYTQELHGDGNIGSMDWELALEQSGIGHGLSHEDTIAALRGAGFLEGQPAKGFAWVRWDEISGGLFAKREADRIRKAERRHQDSAAPSTRRRSEGADVSDGRPADSQAPAAGSRAVRKRDGTGRNGAKRKATALRARKSVALAVVADRIAETALTIVDQARKSGERFESAAEFVFWYWAARHEKRRGDTVYDAKRRRTLLARLGEGEFESTLNILLYATDGSLRDDHLMGRNGDGKKYTGIETIYRDRAQVERLASMVPAYAKGQPHTVLTRAASLGATAAAHAAVEDPTHG